MVEVQEVEKIILENVERVKAEGIKIGFGSYGITNEPPGGIYKTDQKGGRGVCPLGAVLWGREGKGRWSTSLEYYLDHGVDVDFLDGFVAGVDGDTKCPDDSENYNDGYSLGKKLRGEILSNI